MEDARVGMITYKEYIADQGIQAITQPKFLLICCISKESLYLALGIYLRLHLITLVIQTVEILLLYLAGTLMEHTIQYPIGNERTGKTVFLEVQTIAFNLFTAHGKRRCKLSEQSMYAMYRNLPDTEEAQYVVDAVSIKVSCHVLETAVPPLAAILQHLKPVIGRESPVLTIGREVIRWSTRLTIEVEVFRFRPYIATIAVYADWNITLQNNALSLGMLVSLLHLAVQYELYEIEERHVLVSSSLRVGKRLALSLIPYLMIWPLVEISRTILITQV